MNDAYTPLYDALKRSLPHDVIQLREHVISMKAVESVEGISDILPNLTNCLVFSASKEKKPLGDITNVANSDSMLDYGGSPLKIEYYVDYDDLDQLIAGPAVKRRKGQYHPLTASLARELLSAVNISPMPLLHPVVCLCSPSENRRKTLAFGRYKNSTGTRLFELSYEVLEACKAKFNKLLSEQRRKTIPPTKHITTKASAKYQFMALTSGARINRSNDVLSSASIYVEWTDVDTLLMTPPPQAIATLSLKVVCGDKSSLVYSLYEELENLKELAMGLNTGKINWPDAVRTRLPLDLVKELMESQACNDMDEGGVRQTSADLEPRNNLDFTDRLWTILLGCQSYNELSEVVKFVVNSVTGNNSPPLMVSSSNTNSLAKWIYAHQLGEAEDVPNLSSLQVLVYFIEIGVEKLTKDYIHAYLGSFSGLVTMDKLTKFTRSRISIQDKLTDLSKLHTVLELVSLLHAAIRLPLATVRAVTASTLKHLEENPSLPDAGVQLTTSIASIADMVTLPNLDVWQLSLDGSKDSTLVKISRTALEHGVMLACEPVNSAEEIFYCSTLCQHTLDHVLPC